MEDFSSTGQLVTLGLVDSSIGAMAKGLALIDVEISIAKELLSTNLLIGHIDYPISKCRFGNFSSTKNCPFVPHPQVILIVIIILYKAHAYNFVQSARKLTGISA